MPSSQQPLGHARGRARRCARATSCCACPPRPPPAQRDSVRQLAESLRSAAARGRGLRGARRGEYSQDPGSAQQRRRPRLLRPRPHGGALRGGRLRAGAGRDQRGGGDALRLPRHQGGGAPAAGAGRAARAVPPALCQQQAVQKAERALPGLDLAAAANVEISRGAVAVVRGARQRPGTDAARAAPPSAPSPATRAAAHRRRVLRVHPAAAGADAERLRHAPRTSRSRPDWSSWCSKELLLGRRRNAT